VVVFSPPPQPIQKKTRISAGRIRIRIARGALLLAPIKDADVLGSVVPAEWLLESAASR
jgi:hypothetical protein